MCLLVKQKCLALNGILIEFFPIAHANFVLDIMSDVLGPFQFHLKNVLGHEFTNDIQNSFSLLTTGLVTDLKIQNNFFSKRLHRVKWFYCNKLYSTCDGGYLSNQINYWRTQRLLDQVTFNTRQTLVDATISLHESPAINVLIQIQISFAPKMITFDMRWCQGHDESKMLILPSGHHPGQWHLTDIQIISLTEQFNSVKHWISKNGNARRLSLCSLIQQGTVRPSLTHGFL